jgi:hypothetical protein
VISDQGTSLLSGDTNGETSLMMGPSLTREVVAGIANGDFALSPADGTATINDDNPLPYWSFTDTSSGGSITAAIVVDATAASGNALRFSVANNTASGLSAQVSRFFPIPSAKSRSLWQGVEVSVSNITSTANARISAQIDFYASDQTTQVYPALVTTPSLAARTGTTATITTAAAHYIQQGDTVTVTLSSGPTGYAALNGTYVVTSVTSTTIVYTTTTTGTVTSGSAAGTITASTKLIIPFNQVTSTYPDNAFQVPNYVTGASSSRAGTPPANAAYARVVVTVDTVAVVTPAATIDINEIRNIRGFQEIIINDSADPTTYTPAYINNSYGYLTLSTGYQATGQQAQILAAGGLSAGAGGTVTITADQVNLSSLAAANPKLQISNNAYISTSGSNNRTVAHLAVSGSGNNGIDVVASTSSTNPGILITKSVTGQPTTTLNGTGTTDAFADVLRNGGLALDITNSRGYWYASGWKYTALTTPSDSRLKEAIEPISNALSQLSELMPVAFRWKRPEAHQRTDAVADSGQRIGFIADQVATTSLAHWVEALGVDDREADLVDGPDVLAVNIPQNEIEALIVQALLDIDARLAALESR